MSKQHPEPDPAVEKAVRVLATRLFLGFYRRANPAILAALRDAPIPSSDLPLPRAIDPRVVVLAVAGEWDPSQPFEPAPEKETERDPSPFRQWCGAWGVPETPELAEEIDRTQFVWRANRNLKERPLQRLRWGFETSPTEFPEILASRPALRWSPFELVTIGPNEAETATQIRERLTRLFKIALDHALESWRREQRLTKNQGKFRKEALRQSFIRRQTLEHLRWLARKQALTAAAPTKHSALSFTAIAKKLHITQDGAKKALHRVADLIGLPHCRIRQATSKSH